ncbi:fetuin-B [Chanos chanos]|uniref:Fetuin-B n=1 Tax=Chanos chanos TaxID=29144 RepID=A0A6J2WT10_CHACN|nr:fetuin-B-like [Chanos chanos]
MFEFKNKQMGNSTWELMLVLASRTHKGNIRMQTFIWMFFIAHLALVSATGTVDLTHVPCDDKNVEKLARLAITHINEDRQTGYKFALNRISNVQLQDQGPAGKVYYFDIDVLETKCHVLSPKSWKRCDIRPFMETQISGNCNTTVLQTTEGFSYLYSYDCTLVPDPPEKLQQTCPDCPLLLPVDSSAAVSTAQITLRHYNRQSTLPISLTLDSITRASHQTSPVTASFVEYTVQECSVAPLHEALCVPEDAGKGTVGFCVGAVFGTGNIQEGVKVSCEIFDPQRVGMSVGGATKPQVYTLKPTRQQGKSVNGHILLAPDVHKPGSFGPTRDAGVSGPSLVDPVHQTAAPYVPYHSPTNQAVSSESSESAETSSSEEMRGSVPISRPPVNFRFIRYRPRRNAPPGPQPTHSPVILSIFPSAPSPFRSCPGPARYTTA